MDVVEMKDNNKAPLKRNYQIDFLKFFFCFFVIIGHTRGLSTVMPENTAFLKAGYIAVFFFFTVSGYLMIESYERRKKEDHALSAWNFVKSKISGLGKDYLAAMVIAYGIWFVTTLPENGSDIYIYINAR